MDKGRINNFESICRTLGIDDEGNVYGSFGEGQIFKYDPRTDAIRELSVRVPIRQKGISLGRDYDKSETAWRTVVWDKPDAPVLRHRRERHDSVLLRSARPARTAKCGGWGNCRIPGFDDRRDIPYATLSLTLGHDRKLYYGAAAANSITAAARARRRRT